MLIRYLPVSKLRKIAYATIFIGLASAHAANLGSLQLRSALGQPLQVSIPVINRNGEDLDSACIRARLASADGSLTLAPRISLTDNEQASAIHLSTWQSINEPALTLHIEMGCGTVLSRDYQILLDPASVHLQKSAAAFPSVQRQKHSNTHRAVTSASHHQAASPKTSRNDTTDNAPLPTFTREMDLSARHTGSAQLSVSPSSNATNWVTSEDAAPELKLSTSLVDPSGADDAQKTEEFRAAQLRFAAIINGENTTENAEKEMKAAQGKMLQLQAENEQKKRQAITEKQTHDEKIKASLPITWFAALGALLLLCIAAIAWIAYKLVKASNTPTSHPWKNYHAASDTLIADLSTQTLLDSEFMTTVGSSYNTAVFSDTQFDPDPAAIEEDIEDTEEEHDLEEHLAENPVTIFPMPADEEEQIEQAPIEQRNATSPAHKTPAPSDDTAKSLHQPNISAAPADVQPNHPAYSATRESGKEKAIPQSTVSLTAPALKATPSAPAGVEQATQKKKKPTLSVREIADVMQQAEFWMLLQDPFRAIDILEPYRDADHPQSPVPWIYLLDLYRMVGEKKKYESLIVRIEQVFNAKIPRWDGQFGIMPRTLNDFPHVVEKICELWETDEIVPYLESLLLDNRDGARQGFDLPVYRNIIQLITLAREPEKSKAHELRHGKAQAILFSQQVPSSKPASSDPTIAKPVVNAPVGMQGKTESAIGDTSAAVVNHPPAIDDNKDKEQQRTAAAAAVTASADTTKNDLGAKTKEQPAVSVEAAFHANRLEKNDAESDDASPMETKLELALAYQEIGEKDGARELLYEVIKDGTPEQSGKAKSILKGLG